MAKTERIIVRVEPDVKAGSDKLFRSMGITTSDAINMFLYQSLQAKKLPFTVGEGPAASNRK